MNDYNWSLDPPLVHYGIQGMKWGQLRFQNPDGSFTEAGNQRYFGGNHSHRYYEGVIVRRQHKKVQKQDSHIKASRGFKGDNDKARRKKLHDEGKAAIEKYLRRNIYE